MASILTYVLDDDEIVTKFITELFPDDEVRCFNNAQYFYTNFTKEVNMVITDIRIPGFDVIASIKTIQAVNPICYILVISAYFTEDMLMDFIKLRVDSVVKKTHELNWYAELKAEVERLRPKVLEKARLNP